MANWVFDNQCRMSLEKSSLQTVKTSVTLNCKKPIYFKEYTVLRVVPISKKKVSYAG